MEENEILGSGKVGEKVDEILEAEVAFPLYAASRRFIGYYAPWLRNLNITYTQYLVLLLLWEGDNIPVKCLTEKLYLDTGTLTPLINNMSKRGLVYKKRSRQDERVVKVHLTKKGMELKEKASKIPGLVKPYNPLTEEEEATLSKILNKILEASK